MSLHRDPDLRPIADPDDPDDWRPESRWALLQDPAADVAVVVEELAPGDAIPLHRHRVDEVIVVESGEVELRVGRDVRTVHGRSVAFVPAGVEHAARNVGEADAAYTAFFPTTQLDIEYLERNPVPGSEGDPPQPRVVYDARA